MKIRCITLIFAAIVLAAFLVGCKSNLPPLTLAPLQEPEELSQVLEVYNAIVDEAVDSEDLHSVTFGDNYAYGSKAAVLLSKLQALELEPDHGDAIPEGEGYPILLYYPLGQIKLGVMNEEQIDIYYYNTPQDGGVPQYRLKILNREAGKELCEIAENFRQWEKDLDEKSKTTQ